MDSANARDCLLHLARAKLSEREDLVQLNDKFVDIIEHVHYMEAEHAALQHDFHLLKSGIQSDSSGINEIFEVEIRNVRAGIEDINRNRQQLLSEQSLLSQQVKEAEQQWRHTAKAALGVPKEVDEDFARICQIKYEDCLTKRRIKYMEDKNRLIKQNNGRIFEQINLMRMRKDQAVSLQQEYVIRKNELLNSIRNMEEDNKRIIMNEHKYFVRDRNADRHVFRDQLRQAISDIRADYEFKRVRNEEEIRVRLEREIGRINTHTGGSITWDRLKEELLIVKNNCSGLQQQVSNVEIRNAALTQQIELLRLEISENSTSFEISLESKIKEIEKLREQCTSISVELEKLCDLNIDLQKEIAQYRRLLDQSGNVTAHIPGTQVIIDALNRPSNRFGSHSETVKESSLSVSESIYQRSTHGSVTQYQPALPTPIPLPPVPELPPQRDPSPYHPPRGYSPYGSSRSDSQSHRSVIDTTISRYPAVPITVQPIVDNTLLITQSHANSVVRTPSPSVDLRRDHRHYDSIHSSPTVADVSRPAIHDSGHRTSRFDSYHHPSSIGSGVQAHQTITSIEREVVPERSISRPPIPTYQPLAPIGIGASISGNYESNYNQQNGQRSNYTTEHRATHSSSSSAQTTIGVQRESPALQQSVRPQAVPPYPISGGSIESFDSVDEDNFQRFTRWYKGRVKISDVTPDYVQLVNRSSKKSADIGGFKLIHQFGNKSVYVDLPVGFILAPKDSLKIYARSAAHERGAVVAEIDLFDTTIHTNTSIRNTNNEVKSWFVYTSNTEVGDADHHHH